MHELFATFEPIARALPERERLGGPYGAFAHVLHLSWLADRAPQAVIDAHDSVATRHLELARLLTERGDLRRLADDRATVVTAATWVWSDLQKLYEEV